MAQQKQIYIKYSKMPFIFKGADYQKILVPYETSENEQK